MAADQSSKYKCVTALVLSHRRTQRNLSFEPLGLVIDPPLHNQLGDSSFGCIVEEEEKKSGVYWQIIILFTFLLKL